MLPWHAVCLFFVTAFWALALLSSLHRVNASLQRIKALISLSPIASVSPATIRTEIFQASSPSHIINPIMNSIPMLKGVCSTLPCIPCTPQAGLHKNTLTELKSIQGFLNRHKLTCALLDGLKVYAGDIECIKIKSKFYVYDRRDQIGFALTVIGVKLLGLCEERDTETATWTWADWSQVSRLLRQLKAQNVILRKALRAQPQLTQLTQLARLAQLAQLAQLTQSSHSPHILPVSQGEDAPGPIAIYGTHTNPGRNARFNHISDLGFRNVAGEAMNFSNLTGNTSTEEMGTFTAKISLQPEAIKSRKQSCDHFEHAEHVDHEHEHEKPLVEKPSQDPSRETFGVRLGVFAEGNNPRFFAWAADKLGQRERKVKPSLSLLSDLKSLASEFPGNDLPNLCGPPVSFGKPHADFSKLKVNGDQLKGSSLEGLLRDLTEPDESKDQYSTYCCKTYPLPVPLASASVPPTVLTPAPAPAPTVQTQKTETPMATASSAQPVAPTPQPATPEASPAPSAPSTKSAEQLLERLVDVACNLAQSVLKDKSCYTDNQDTSTKMALSTLLPITRSSPFSLSQVVPAINAIQSHGTTPLSKSKSSVGGSDSGLDAFLLPGPDEKADLETVRTYLVKRGHDLSGNPWTEEQQLALAEQSPWGRCEGIGGPGFSYRGDTSCAADKWSIVCDRGNGLWDLAKTTTLQVSETSKSASIHEPSHTLPSPGVKADKKIILAYLIKRGQKLSGRSWTREERFALADNAGWDEADSITGPCFMYSSGSPADPKEKTYQWIINFNACTNKWDLSKLDVVPSSPIRKCSWSSTDNTSQMHTPPSSPQAL